MGWGGSRRLKKQRRYVCRRMWEVAESGAAKRMKGRLHVRPGRYLGSRVEERLLGRLAPTTATTTPFTGSTVCQRKEKGSANGPSHSYANFSV